MVSFSDILGQDQAIDWLRSALAEERLPHGLVFAGPAGVGKGTTAAALAGLFLCETPKGDRSCGKCNSCALFMAGNHPDYHVIYRQLVRLEKEEAKARDLSIDIIRDYLIGPANLKAAMTRGKVFVIEEADRMSTSAQNALLKTLEEPLGRTLIILLTDRPNGLLPTIRSRCQLVRFAPLEEDLVCRELEKRKISKGDAADAARYAEGSLGLALRWLEDGVIARARELTKRLDATVGGRIPGDFSDWLRLSADEYAKKQLDRDPNASKDQATREGFSLYLQLAAQDFRRRLAESDDAGDLERFCSAIDAAAKAQEYLDANVTTALIFQQFVVTLERLFDGAVALQR